MQTAILKSAILDTYKIPKDPFIKDDDNVEGSKKKKWSKFACGYVFKNIFERRVGQKKCRRLLWTVSKSTFSIITQEIRLTFTFYIDDM